jgi:hypothetical protein
MNRRTKAAIKALHPKPKTMNRKIKNKTRGMYRRLVEEMFNTPESTTSFRELRSQLEAARVLIRIEGIELR